MIGSPSLRRRIWIGALAITWVFLTFLWMTPFLEIPARAAGLPPKPPLATGYPGPSPAPALGGAVGVLPCNANQLAVTAPLRAEPDRVGGEIVATNTSSTSCAVRGSPWLPLVDAHDHAVEHGYIQTPGGVTSPLVMLDPGQSARAELIWWSYCGPSLTLPIRLASVGWGGSTIPVHPGPATIDQTPPCVDAAPPEMEILPWAPAGTSAPHDERYFPQTHFRIDNDTIWDYFNRRGGVATFGYPISRTFVFQGFTVQFFQRRVVQLAPDGHARLLNLLDSNVLPYTSFNVAQLPAIDSAIAASPPTIESVRRDAPDSYQGMPVNFYQTFMNTVSYQAAFPQGGGDPSLVPGFDLEMWGVPTSAPQIDPTNHNIVYLRWQRGIMQYDATCTCTRAILLADYLKSVLTGTNLSVDLASEAASSAFDRQYDPSVTGWVRDPRRLPVTDLTNAFTPE